MCAATARALPHMSGHAFLGGCVGLQRQRLSLRLLPYSQRPTPTHRHSRAPPTSTHHTVLPTAAPPPARPPVHVLGPGMQPGARASPLDSPNRTNPHRPSVVQEMCARGQQQDTKDTQRAAADYGYKESYTLRGRPSLSLSRGVTHHMCPTGLPAGCGAAGLTRH